MKLKPYPSYRDSGVEWLGHVPDGWDVKPLKNIASINDEVLSEVTGPEEEIEYVDIGSVTVENGIEKTELMKFSAAPSRARRKVRDGDVIVSTVRTYLKAIAPIKNPPSNLVCSTGFAVVRPNQDFNPAYAKYSMQTGYFIDEVIARSVGVSYPAINSSDMMCIRMTAPPINVQSMISRFLDRETGKLDALIAKQEHLIELLQEKRQAIITHAVTKGLNPDAKMKDSGVEWLGLIPDGWIAAPLKKMLFQPLMYGANEASDESDPENPRYVRITDIDSSGNLREDTFRSLPKDIAASYLLRDGDILLARSGATVGKSFIYRDTWGVCCFAGYLIKASVDKNIMDADFMYACFQSTFYWQYINSEQIQATIQNVSAERYGNFKIPVPPIKEQRGIVLFLNQQTAKIDNLIEKAKRSIELAKEHRSALITAAVTGKIDVREAA